MDIGKLTTIFDADTTNLERGAEKASESVKKAEVDITSVMRSIDTAVARTATEAAAQFQKLAQAEGMMSVQLAHAFGKFQEHFQSIGNAAKSGLGVAQTAWERIAGTVQRATQQAAESAILTNTKFYDTVERGRQAFVGNLINVAEKESSSIISMAVKTGQVKIDQERKYAEEVKKINAETAKQAAEQFSLRQRAAKVVGDPQGQFTGIPQQGIVQVREARAAANELRNTLAETAKESDALTIAQIALGNIIANIAVRAFERLATVIYDTLVGSTLYAARTEELAVALRAIANANHISTAEILGQEEAIKKLNLTTQDTRQVLGRMVIAQMDSAKAFKLASAAQDLAVIAGKTTQEELQQLTHGIITLQSRVLRNAGVFTTAEEAEKKYAKTVNKTIQELSTQEKQHAVLTEVLLQGARAVGTYDAAMTTAAKQLRSMERLQAEASNTIGGFFQGPLMLGIQILSRLLEVVAKYPGGLALAATAVGALTFAFVALNTSMGVTTYMAFRAAITSVISVVTQAIPQIILLGKVMLGLHTLAQGAMATTIAATAGWAAVILAAGAAIYFLVNQTDELPEVDERAVLAMQNLITAMKDDVMWFDNASEAVQSHSEYVGRLESSLRRLDPITAVSIKGIKDEATQRQAVIEKLREQLALRERDRQLQLEAVVAVGTDEFEKYSKQLDNFDRLTKRGIALQAEINKLSAMSVKQADLTVPNEFRGQSQEYLTLLQQKLQRVNFETVTLGNTVLDGSPKFQTMSRHLAEAATQAGQTAEEFLVCRSATLLLTEAEDGLAKSAQSIIDDLKEQEERYRGVAGAMTLYREALEGIKPPDIKISETTEGITKQWELLGIRFQDTWQALTKDFGQKGTPLDGWKEAIKGFSEEFVKLDKATADVMGSGYGAFIKSLPQTIQDARSQAATLEAQSGAIKSYSEKVLEAMKAQDEARKKQERDIKSMADTLKTAIGSQIEKQQELTDGMGKGANAIRDLAKWYAKLDEEEQRLIQTTPKLLALYQQLTAEAERTKNIQKGTQFNTIIEEAVQAIEGIQDKIYGVKDSTNEATTAAEKFRDSFEKAGGKAAATAQQYLQYLQVLRILERQERTMINIDREKGFEQVRKGLNSIETQFDSLINGRRTTELDRFIQSIFSMKGVDLPENMFEGIAAFAEEALTSAEAYESLLTVVKSVLMTAPGVSANDVTTMGQKIARILMGVADHETAVGRIRAEMGRQDRELSDQREALNNKDLQGRIRIYNREREQLSIETAIKRLQDEMADGSYNSALRVQAQLLQDIVAFRRRDEEALVAENRAQIELADKFTFHMQQARAIILSTFAQAKSVTEIWADSITGSVDMLVNSVSGLMDRLMARLGLFGAIFGQIIKQVIVDMTRLLVQKLIMKVLGGEKDGDQLAAAGMQMTAAVVMTTAAGIQQVAADVMLLAANIMAASGAGAGGGAGAATGGGGSFLGGLLRAIVGGAISGLGGGAMGGGASVGDAGLSSLPFFGSFGGRFAKGGFVSPGMWGIAGERGPEPVYGGVAGMTVFPNEAMNGGGEKNVNVTINVSDSRKASSYSHPRSEREIAEQVGAHLQRHLG